MKIFFSLYRKRLAEKLEKVGHRTISITCRKKVGTKTGAKSGSTDSKEVIDVYDDLKQTHLGI